MRCLSNGLRTGKNRIPASLGVLVIRLLSDPRMGGEQPYRGFDGIGEALRQSDVFPVRRAVRLQRDVGE